MKKINNKNGFSHILVPVIGLVILVVGIIGYRIATMANGESDHLSESGHSSSINDPIQTQVGTEIKIGGGADNSSGEDKINTNHSSDSSHTTNTTQKTAPSSGSTSKTSGDSGGGSSSEGESSKNNPVKKFVIDAFNFGYSRSKINVSAGDKVVIKLTNSDGYHDFVIDELGVSTDQISSGETDTVSFTVPNSAAGKTYKFYCSVSGHRALGMEGSFIIAN